MGYKLGVTTGLHYVARSEELATTVKKLGFGITRGTRAIEIALDVPHEITQTEGKTIRDIAGKQGVDVLVHGSLTMPIDLPERSDWRDADDHIKKSVRSAIRAGAKYVDFHASLNIWLELVTYAGRKLTLSFCDHEGRFIRWILKESEKLREWFIREKSKVYWTDILSREERTEVSSEIDIRNDSWYKEEAKKRLSGAGISGVAIERFLQTNVLPDLLIVPSDPPRLSQQEAERNKELVKKGHDIISELRIERTKMSSDIQEEVLGDIIRRKLANGDPWDSEELRSATGVLDGYHIMAHYMFYEKDPLWTEMAKLYPFLNEEYGMDYSDNDWLEKAWKKAEDSNDRRFKTFFYGVVAAKYLQGHLKRMFEWMQDEKKGLLSEDWIAHPKLKDVAKNLIIAIESPDARDAQHAGLHTLWETRQIYTAVKVIRNELAKAGLPGDRVWMLADFEHVATQGVDPVVDLEKVVEVAPDLGKYCISIHANAPNPMHAHETLELGDVRVYKFLYYLRQTGFGKNGDVYVIYERGGGEDPFMRSVEALRLMLKFVQKDIHPDKLKDYPEFWGYKGAVAGDETRQLQIIREHAYEPLRDLMEMPDEEFGMLSRTIMARGKRPEQWKKAEFR